LVPVQVSADKEKNTVDTIMWCCGLITPPQDEHEALPDENASGTSSKLNAVTDGQKEALMNERAQLFGSVCVQRDKSY